MRFASWCRVLHSSPPHWAAERAGYRGKQAWAPKGETTRARRILSEAIGPRLPCRGQASNTWRAPSSAARSPSPPPAPTLAPEPPPPSPPRPPRPRSRRCAHPSTTAFSASSAPRSPTSPSADLPTRRRADSSRSPWRTARGSSGCASAPAPEPRRSRSRPPCSTAPPRPSLTTRPSSAASSRSSAGHASTSASSPRSPGATVSLASSAPPGPTTSSSATSSPPELAAAAPAVMAVVVDAITRNWGLPRGKQ